MKTLAQASEKYIRNSVRAYLEGTQSQQWLLGVAGSVSTDDVRQVLTQYPNEPRLDFLKNTFQK